MSQRPKVSTARIIRLYSKHKNFGKVARIVKRDRTSVRVRLVRAGIVPGKITRGQ